MCLCIVRACPCTLAISCTIVHGQFWTSLLLPQARYNLRWRSLLHRSNSRTHTSYVQHHYMEHLCELHMHISKNKSEDQLLPVQDARGPIYLASRISNFLNNAWSGISLWFLLFQGQTSRRNIFASLKIGISSFTSLLHNFHIFTLTFDILHEVQAFLR